MFRPAHSSCVSFWPTVARFLIQAPVAVIVCAMTGCMWLQQQQEENSQLCQSRIEKSFLLQQEGELEEAREQLTRALDVEPKNAETWWHLAELSIQQDQYAQAIQEQKKYLELQENDPHGYLRLAQLHYLQNEYEPAQEALKQTIRRIPNNVEAIMLSARLARKQADHEQALADYYHVLQVMPNHPEATLELAEMLLEQTKPVQAASILRGLARTNLSNEDRARTHLNLGVAYGQADRWDDAVENLTVAESLTDDPEGRDRYRLAYAHYRAGTSQQALQILLKMADSGQWNDRAEKLYGTMTNSDPYNAYTASVLTASHEIERDEGHPFLQNQNMEPAFEYDRLLKEMEEAEISIVPPEWSKVGLDGTPDQKE